MITTSAELAGLLDALPSNGPPYAGIDLEADNLHRYAEQLCLIQITDGRTVVLVDPLEVEDLTPFREYLASTPVWMHGADFDMTLLRREFGVLPKMIFDTQIAARLLGILRFSYANLVEQFFEVQLCKASQKENRGRRPLPPKMCEYAMNDVRYLLPLAEILERDLHAKERYEWFRESCEAAMDRVMERDGEREDPWRIRGAGKLDRHALCYLRALWVWRDHEAREWDRPPFMVVRNQQLTDWSDALAGGGKIEFPRNVRGARAGRLNSAIEEARQIPKAEWPERRKGSGRRWDSAQEKRFDALARKRDEAAAGLAIEPSVIAPRAALEQIAWDADPSEHLLGWQRSLLGL
jgi:ribonuclease D